jgi:hypothetical protein
MPSRPRAPFVWLILGVFAMAGAVLLLFLLNRNPATTLDLSGAGESDRTESAAAVAARQKTGGPTETTQSRTAAPAQPGPASREQEFDERYRRALAGIRGRILRHDQAPLADFPVEALLISTTPFVPTLETQMGVEEPHPGLRVASARTDPEGRFLLSPIQPRCFHVLVLGAGTSRARVHLVDRSSAPGEVVDLGDIVLAQGAILTGTVVDQDGTPVPDARVWVADFPAIVFSVGLSWLTPEGGVCFKEPTGAGGLMVLPFPAWLTEILRSPPLAEAVTGPTGEFRLEDVRPGRPSLWIRKPGLIPLVHGPVAAEVGKERKLGRLTMQGGEEATGRVVDARGAGVAGAQVMIGPVAALGLPLSFLRPLPATDANGGFTVDCLGREKIQLVARRQDGDPWTCSKPLSPDDTLVVQLEEGASVRVFATSTRDGALPSVKFRLTPDNPLGSVRGVLPSLLLGQRAVRQEDQSFRITGLGKGAWRLVGFADGHVPAGQSFTVEEQQQEPVVRLELTPGFPGRITVLEDSTSEPVACARVLVQGEAFGGSGKLLAEDNIPLDLGMTGRNGELAVACLPAGTHHVFVRHPQFGQKHAVLTVPGEALVVRMDACGQVAGMVTQDGAPPAETCTLSLELLREGDKSPVTDPPLLAFTAPDGSFHFGGVAPGKYRVEAMDRIVKFASITDVIKAAELDENSPRASAEVQVVAGREAKVTLDLQKPRETGPTGRIVGEVTVNNVPRAGLVVSAQANRRHRAVTDAAGRFELDQVGAQPQVWLTIADEESDVLGTERTLLTTMLAVKEGQTAEVRLAIETGDVRGRVTVAADGSPAAGVGVFASAVPGEGKPKEGESSGAQYVVITDDKGRFEIKGIAAGTYAFGVHHEGFAKKPSRPVVVRRGEAGDEVRLELIPAVTVAGTVEIEGGGKDLNWQWVHFQPTEGDANLEGKGGQVESGRFECGGLAPGKYQVHFYTDAQSFEPVALTVTGNMTGVHLKFVRAKPPVPPAEGNKEKEKEDVKER